MEINIIQIFSVFFGFMIIGPAFMLPTLVAINRKHRQVIFIALVNCMFGWTMIGWGVAFVWSFMGSNYKQSNFIEK